ncbi:MAG TPA: lipid kinase YegS [Lysobacter sp.]|nr:lipid kinase YegS [Lysobacter sp.]
MERARWRLILNGKAATDEAVRAAVAAMRAQVELEVRLTWERGDGARYAREALDDGVATLIAGGGDGTFSEVAATLAERDEAADALPSLALLPLGTANDFATAAALPLTPEPALELARTQPPQPIDLLRIEAEDADGTTRVDWCANLASGGFGTQVTVETDEALKKLLGGLAYVITGIARLGQVEPVRARLRGADFDWSGAFIALALGNGRQAGGGQLLCPDAVIDDGRLDLTLVPELEGEFATTVRTLLTEGRHAALERVAERAQLPWVHIEAEAPLTLNLDGEPLTATRFRVVCVPRRLRMHLPPGCPLLSFPGTPAGAEPEGPQRPPAVVPA